MVGRGKSKQARLKRSSSGLMEDRISQLPDHLVCQILSHLPAKDTVRTSVLSTRWRSLWLWVPKLELDSNGFRDFNAFVSFGDRFFDSSRVSCLDKLKLTIDEYYDGVRFYPQGIQDTSYFTSWIDAAVKRHIHHLDVKCPPQDPEYHEMPLTFYICKTLVYLKLFQASFFQADLSELSIAEFVSLPCLKTMHLVNITYPNEATFEGLVSSCPVLEELTIVGCVTDDTKVFRVLSRSLKKLSIELEVCIHDFCTRIVIDAPQLRFLSITDDLSESFIIKNMHSKAKLDISLAFGLGVFNEENVLSKRSMIHDFLPGISGVKEMIISPETFKVICLYSKLEHVPQFRYMSRLHAKLYVPDLKWLTTFLESYPNLKSLILVWAGYYQKMHSDEMNQISFSSIPECLLSSLEFVDIKSSISGHVAEMKLVRYFLESSVILKKLTLRLNYCANVNVIFKKLLKIPRRSIICQVVVR